MSSIEAQFGVLGADRKEKINQEQEESESPAIKKEMEQFLKREKREKASFMVKIDKVVLDQEIAKTDDENGKSLLEMFQKLPENLNFQPGKTLIIGDNASGKSTMAKALFLAFKKEKTADNHRESAASLNDENWFKNADQLARKEVLEANGQYWQEWLLSSGLAPNLAKAIAVNDYFSSSPTVEYADFHEIIGRIKSRYDGMGISGEVLSGFSSIRTRADIEEYKQQRDYAVGRHLEKVSTMSKEMGSARQTVEKQASQLIHGDNNEPGPGVFFLDEPESGISPMRHRKIEENIDEMIGTNDSHQGSITIIPTNSIKLFESDLPRIDLRYPERGIFRPSQYPGYFEE